MVSVGCTRILALNGFKADRGRAHLGARRHSGQLLYIYIYVKRLPRFSAIVRLFTLVNVPFSILHLVRARAIVRLFTLVNVPFSVLHLI